MTSLATVWILILPGCGTSESEPNAHDRMVAVLSEIRDRSVHDHPYIGDAQLKQAKQAQQVLSTLSPEATAARFHTQWVLGYHLARAGRLQESTEAFEAAYQLFDSVRSSLERHQREQFLLHIAAAYLRVGETENCVHCTTGESCVLPLKGGGIHNRRAGTQSAARYLQQLLHENPDHLAGRWLSNIAAMALDQYPESVADESRINPAKFSSSVEFPRFENIARPLDVDALNLCGGSVIDDFDNDGYLDIFTSTWDTAEEPILFRNRGDGTFQRQIEESGLTGLYGGLNLVQADYDNDGAVDILVLRGAWLGEYGRHPNSLLKNDGRGHFRDVTFEAGLANLQFPTQTAVWADFNNDSHLDLYIGNEGGASKLMMSDGHGKFRDITRAAGVTNDRFAKGVVAADFNNDGYTDLYVSNYQQENRLYRNNKDNTFTDVAPTLGVTAPVQSFPVWFWDYNNDGNLDLYVSSWWPDVKYVAAEFLDVDHEAEPARLYTGDGKGGFVESAAACRLTAVSQPMGANFGDLDSDGWPDIFLGTGYPEYEALMPNLVYRNVRGTHFEDVTMAGGFGHLQKGHGVAFGDLNNNGTQDIYVQLGGAYPGDKFRNLLLKNPGFGHHWIGIKLVGVRSNRSAIGARICIVADCNGQLQSHYRWVNSGGSFGANPLQQQIGIGPAERIDHISIMWPASKQEQIVRNVDIDQFIEVTEGTEGFVRRHLKAFEFADGAPETAAAHENR